LAVLVFGGDVFMRAKTMMSTSVAMLIFAAAAMPATAACKKMGFTVNDYGKDGPTKDAKDLLDKEIAKWAADNGIAKYTVGKKDVKCELFIDVILFDEHTCTASASVCWNEGGSGDSAPKPKVEATSPKKQSKAPVETGAIESTGAESAPAAADKPAAAKPAAEPDAAERAAAAAERAAAAAERAAAAAEKAAAGPAAAAEPEPATQVPASEAAGEAEKAP
jgi:hypothetical protein